MHGDDQTREIDVREYLRVLRRRKWVVIATFVLVVVVSTGLAAIQAPTYSSSAEVLVQPPATIYEVDPNNADVRDRARTLQNEIAFVESDQVRSAVAEEYGSSPEISVLAAENADVLTFTATAGDPEEAAQIANTYARVFIEERRERQVDDYLRSIEVLARRIDNLQQQRRDLVAPLVELDQLLAVTPPGEEADRLQSQRNNLDAQISGQRASFDQSILTLQTSRQTLQLSSQLQSGGARIKTLATPNSAPVSPNLTRSATLGAVLGLLLGIALAFLYERFDDSIKSKVDLERATHLAVIALIPKVKGWRKREVPRIVSLDDPLSPPAEAYRTMRTSLQFLDVDRALSTLLVTSAGPGAGKSTTVANLAVTLAQAGEEVVAVCCDLRRPRLHEFFGLDNDVGFTSVLANSSPLEDALRVVADVPNLRILPSGPIPPNPAELLMSERAQNILLSLTARGAIVLIDSPPVLPVSDALVLSSAADGVVLVVASGTTTKREASRAVELLGLAETPLVGSVLNGVSATDGYGYGYGYERYTQREPASV